MDEKTARDSAPNDRSAALVTATRGGVPKKRRRPKSPELAVLSRPELKLERPLSLFPGLSVSMSSSLALGPDTLLRVMTGAGTIDWVRKSAPGYISLLRKLAYVTRKEHALSPGLRKLVLTEFAPLHKVLPKAEIEKSLDDLEHIIARPTSPWAPLLGGMQADGNLRLDDTLVRMCQWMVACDEHAFYLEDLVSSGQTAAAEAHLAPLIGEACEAWLVLNPKLAMQALAAIEVPLMALARLEYEGAEADAGPGIEIQSSILRLLEPDARPIGHLVSDVCSLAGCRNLGELSTALLRSGATYRAGAVSHERLKKWARSKEVAMPPGAVGAVLMAVPSSTSRDMLTNRFGAARLLTFLCDLVRSSTIGAAPTWPEAQSQIRSRFAHAFQNQAALRSSRSAVHHV